VRGSDKTESHHLFRSEAAWPFALREEELLDCLAFLNTVDQSNPAVLRLFGESGSGKTFFSRELLTRFAKANPQRLILYLDTPAADLEATEFTAKLDVLLSRERIPDRDKPIQVPSKVVAKWLARKKRPLRWKTSYAYRVTRDLIGQIPVIGPFVKAILPASLSLDGMIDQPSLTAFRHVISLSKSTDVLLAIDNIQFLPDLIRDVIEDVLLLGGSRLRLVLIERLHGEARIDWKPPIENATFKDCSFGEASIPEIEKLVRAVIPTYDDPGSLAKTLHRRSDGNLKSVWFQMKFIAQRQGEALTESSSGSYEGVILSLNSVDQAVLRVVVFLLGGLSITHVTKIFEASEIGMTADSISAAITDLTILGLIIVNSDARDRVRVEHEMVSHVVANLTPEDEKLDLRVQLVIALDHLLKKGPITKNDAALYDRLIGITDEVEVRNSPSLQSHVVKFLNDQHGQEKFEYLSTLLRDSVCWNILDILPNYSIRILLNAIQKCSLFSFGLIAAERLKASASHAPLAALYEAKYLVQLFRYDEATRALEVAPQSRERDLVRFNIMINLCQDDQAIALASEVYNGFSAATHSEYEIAILRNSGHLFPRKKAIIVLNRAVEGFQRLGMKFGVATALNNLGVAEIEAGDLDKARHSLQKSRQMLEALESAEVYQPIVNLAGLAVARGRFPQAKKLMFAARRATPQSLVMDAVMLDFNDQIIDLVGCKEITHNQLASFQLLHDAARRTRDLRFIETIAWFIGEFEVAFTGMSTTRHSPEIMALVRNNVNSGLELFVPVQVSGKIIEAPFFLSPHWRY